MVTIPWAKEKDLFFAQDPLERTSKEWATLS